MVGWRTVATFFAFHTTMLRVGDDMDNRMMEKLTVLGEGAKYDASCSSSGIGRSNTMRIGNTSCAGICHSWGSDGRCISLLKVLLSNDCAYDCKYCVNRVTADVPRETFEPAELAELTVEFYRRNYIEGLFLSSAVIGTPDHTSELMCEALKVMREDKGFAGYIHTKIIPGTSQELIHQIGLLADRVSVNIEVPTKTSLELLAPQKHEKNIFIPMLQIRDTQLEQGSLKLPGFMNNLKTPGFQTGHLPDFNFDERMLYDDAMNEGELPSKWRGSFALDGSVKRRRHGMFAGAGQTTQMIVGASPEADRTILNASEALYRGFGVKRVYFSAYIPVSDDPALPSRLMKPPLLREHRLYQADWLLRFYGFAANEILTEENPNLDYEFDPKLIWALRHIELFPIEINKASMEELLRIPGIGNVTAKRILRQRKVSAVRYEDLKKMGAVLKRARYFLTCVGKYYGDSELEPYYIRDKLRKDQMQATLGANANASTDRNASANMPHFYTTSADANASERMQQFYTTSADATNTQMHVTSASGTSAQGYTNSGASINGLQSANADLAITTMDRDTNQLHANQLDDNQSLANQSLANQSHTNQYRNNQNFSNQNGLQRQRPQSILSAEDVRRALTPPADPQLTMFDALLM
ncbi:MAG: putative DNA modification/repair radical SAM protein [Clostridiales Family XIII bacterium]|jgi:putative DNA modification/repair radical SAM protein|nr:putative DNA modification/repair radical SAM protein [Clostridiales Family XIII bacterium]